MPSPPDPPGVPGAVPGRGGAEGAAPDHYFSAEPASAADRRPLVVQLAGRTVTVQTAGGIFSPGRIDVGTGVLLRTVPPPPPTGDLLDLGCGWGPLALTMALHSPAARVWAVDVNARALDLLRRSAEDLGVTNLRAVTPDGVPPETQFAAIWSNPPIRVGKRVLHPMLEHWLPRLVASGEAHLVVQRNLGADSLQRWIAETLDLSVDRVASAKGFRVLRARHR